MKVDDKRISKYIKDERCRLMIYYTKQKHVYFHMHTCSNQIPRNPDELSLHAAISVSDTQAAPL